MKAIDLGRKSEGPLGLPEKPSEKYYPSLYVDGDKELADLPECGTMTVYFKVNSRTTSERDGKTTSSISLEIQQILDVESDEDETSERKSTEATLDKYAEEETKSKE